MTRVLSKQILHCNDKLHSFTSDIIMQAINHLGQYESHSQAPSFLNMDNSHYGHCQIGSHAAKVPLYPLCCCHTERKLKALDRCEQLLIANVSWLLTNWLLSYQTKDWQCPTWSFFWHDTNIDLKRHVFAARTSDCWCNVTYYSTSNCSLLVFLVIE